MEYNLQRSHVSFWKLWTLINIWEVVALPPVWVASVPLQGLTFAQSPKNLLDGFQCLFVGQGSVEGADDEECLNDEMTLKRRGPIPLYYEFLYGI